MKRIRFLGIGCLMLFGALGVARAGTLTDSGTALPRLAAGAMAWGDYNGDGDADLVVAGELVEEGSCARITRVFRNEGGELTALPDLLGVSYGDVAWGDYDKDGDLDLAVSGWDSAGDEVAVLYRQNEAGGFEEDVRQSALVGVRYSAMAWGDYDADGDLDLIICGMEAGGTPSTRLYKNEGMGGMRTLEEDVSQSIVYVNKGSVAWGDYDQDGDVDLAINGFDRDGYRTAKIYRNDPTGTLREDKDSSVGLSLPEAGEAGGVIVGRLAWGDLDGDGDLDLAVSGWNRYWEKQVKVYKNDAPGLLVGPFVLNLERVAGSLAWGDYDNNGYLDLAVVGRDYSSQAFAFVLKNEDGVLTKDQNLTGVRSGSVGWADYDGDGALDLLAIGEEAGMLYKNDEVRNEKPFWPEQPRVSSFVTGRRVRFSWGGGGDAETPVDRLTYNLRVSLEGGGGVFSGAVGVGPGCVGNRFDKTLFRPLSEGTYLWSVQAVDTGFERSVWSQDEILRVDKFVGSDQELLNLERGAMALGDYDNDGDPDLVMCGRDVNDRARTILYENVLGVWKESRESALKGVQNGDLAWGDYDRDGDLDLALCGEDASGNPISLIYRNDEFTGTLVPDASNSGTLAQVRGGSLDWGDYDNDGDPDLVLVGQTEGIVGSFLDAVAVVYRNDSGVLVEDSTQTLQGVKDGKVRWGDYDEDGDLDLALTGGFWTGERFTRIYENDPAGQLRGRSDLDLVGLTSSALVWGDYDGDGDLDLAICGQDVSGTSVSKVYRNDGGMFSEALVNLAGVDIGSLAWGDYDNDGTLDLVLSGKMGRTPGLKIYKNDGAGNLTEGVFQALVGVQGSSVGWCDVDDDGDLDLVASGQGEDLLESSRVYDNLESFMLNPNTPPEPPSGLTAVSEDSSVTLSWGTGSDGAYGTPAQSLRYDLRVGTDSGGDDVRSGKAALKFGDIGLGRSLMLRGLESGFYYWSVRTVDNGLARSAWSREERLVIDTIPPTAAVTVVPSVVGIGQDVTVIVVFSEAHSGMNAAISPKVTFVSEGGTEVVVGAVSFAGGVWTGKASVSRELASGIASVSVEGATDEMGNEMTPNPAAAAFRIDTEMPVATLVAPEPDQAGVRRSSNVTITFSETMDGSSVAAEYFKLMRGGEAVGGAFSYDAGQRTALFDPAEELAQDTEYEAWISSSVRDSVGNRMAEDFRWRFRTARVVGVWPGGTLVNDAETVSLFLPPNALDSDEEIALKEIPQADLMPLPEGVVATGAGMLFEAVGADTLRKPGTLRMGVGEGGEGPLAIFRREEGGSVWLRLGGNGIRIRTGSCGYHSGEAFGHVCGVYGCGLIRAGGSILHELSAESVFSQGWRIEYFDGHLLRVGRGVGGDHRGL
ncbi:MAG: FG-GAP-like repeat-containing protein [Candidatus Latescibacterota bacterium]